MILIDSNVILDIVTKDSNWYDWSAQALKHAADNHELAINSVIYAEVSIGFEKIEELDQALPPENFVCLPILKEVAFLAGKCFFQYRKNGGQKKSTLPDFFIGAHAAILKMPLLTRDINRYKTYFPRLEIIAPE